MQFISGIKRWSLTLYGTETSRGGSHNFTISLTKGTVPGDETRWTCVVYSWHRGQKHLFVPWGYWMWVIIYCYKNVFYFSDQFYEKQLQEKIEDTKVVIRSCKTKKDRQHNGQRKRTKEQTTIYKTLHRKLKIEQHEPH